MKVNRNQSLKQNCAQADALSRPSFLQKLSAAVALSKPRLSTFVVLSGAGGYGLASSHPGHLFNFLNFMIFCVALYLIVAAANTHNCYLEKDVDAKMSRTKSRPLVTGTLSSKTALILGFAELLLAMLLFYKYTDALSSFLAFLGYASYVLFYTPLKRISMTALFVGAVPGALPPMIGWTSVTQNLDLGAWILFGILFVWQLPHFIAISLNRLEEYKNAGLFTMPGSLGVATAQRQMMLYTLLLLVLTFVPFIANMAGVFYFSIAALMLIVSSVFVWQGFVVGRKFNWNRVVFFGSLAYLPLVLGAWVLDRWFMNL